MQAYNIDKSWNTGVKGTPLLRRTKNGPMTEPMIDVCGVPILCRGGWNSPGNLTQLLSAVTCIHSAKNQTGDFKDSCPRCFAELDTNPNGCRVHLGRPQHWRVGRTSFICYLH